RRVPEHHDLTDAEQEYRKTEGLRDRSFRLDQRARGTEEKCAPGRQAEGLPDQLVEPWVVAGDDCEGNRFDRRQGPRLTAAHELPVPLQDLVELHSGPSIGAMCSTKPPAWESGERAGRRGRVGLGAFEARDQAGADSKSSEDSAGTITPARTTHWGWSRRV